MIIKGLLSFQYWRTYDVLSSFDTEAIRLKFITVGVTIINESNKQHTRCAEKTTYLLSAIYEASISSGYARANPLNVEAIK